jgi:hypothetical protein
MRLVHAALLVQHSPAGTFGGIIGLQEGVWGFLGSFFGLAKPLGEAFAPIRPDLIVLFRMTKLATPSSCLPQCPNQGTWSWQMCAGAPLSSPWLVRNTIRGDADFGR